MSAPWMEIAWEQEGAGVEEIGGKAAHKSVLMYFRENNRAEVTSDEVPWCAAFYFWCLQKADVEVSSIAPKERLLAASAVRLGLRIDGPRVGCARISKRIEGGKVVGHHVGFVTGWTATRVKLLGGNQSNKVCETEFKRNASDIYIWPPAPATVKEVAQASRISDAAGDIRKDTVKLTTTQVGEKLMPAPDQVVPALPEPQALVDQAGAFKTMVAGAEDFLMFSWGKVWWIAAALALFWLVRMAWNAGWIRWWRAEDHNTGKSVIAAAPVPAGDADLWEADDAQAA
jgi:uncharacterized protein (TIGR02594 family)